MICRVLLLGIIWMAGLPLLRADSHVGPQLEVRLRLDKILFESGEPIPVSVQLLNHGDSEYLVQASTELTGALDGWSFVVCNAEGENVGRAVTRLRATSWIGSWLALRRDDKCERQIFLNHWTPPLSVGAYTVEAVYQPHSVANGTPRDWPAVRTAPVKFQIQPVTDTKLEIRISRLAGQASKGDILAIDFLGFTGDSAAIDPLLDSAYEDDPIIQQRATFALDNLIEADTVRKAVLKRLGDSGLNATLVEWLIESGTPSETIVPMLLAAARSEESNARAVAFAGLRRYLEVTGGDRQFAPPIRALMQDGLQASDGRIRYEAVVALRQNLDEETTGVFSKLAKSDPINRIRQAAAAALKRNDNQQQPQPPP